MSRHEGVSCDTCLKGNFRGRRYKCLTCYDYDLCASCYEAGATTTRHSIEHPMQCILTRSDFELYYGGEALTTEQSQSFTCPFCGKMGFTETGLLEHVNAEHPDSTVEVVCPICAAQPGGDPNLVTEDFAGHLALEHRPTTSRDLISFLDEPAATRHGVRRIPHPTRGIGGSRPRRTNMHFSSSGGISSLSPSGRDAVDPIAELLSQLSGVRRNNPTQGSASAQLQQLQMQLQLERQQVRAARQQVERLPRRGQVHSTAATLATSGTTSTTVTSLSNHVLSVSNASGGTSASKPNDASGNSNTSAHAQPHFQLMLTKCMDTSLSEIELEILEIERADRSIFMQDVLLNTLMINDDDDDGASAAAAAAVPADEKDEKLDRKRVPRERASPIQLSPPQQQSSAVAAQSATIIQSSSAIERSSKNGLTDQVVSSSKRVQQRNSPPPIMERTAASQQRTMSSPNRIELMITRPHQPSSGNNINVREVLAGNNNYANPDTARRKPICTVDSINQTTEPPTSH